MNYLVKADDMFPLVFGLMVFDSGYDIRVGDISDRFALIHQTRFFENERYIADGVSAAYSFSLTDSARLFVGANASLEQHQYSNYFHNKYATLSPIAYIAQSFVRSVPIRAYVQANIGKMFYALEKTDVKASHFNFSPKTEFLLGVSYVIREEKYDKK